MKKLASLLILALPFATLSAFGSTTHTTAPTTSINQSPIASPTSEVSFHESWKNFDPIDPMLMADQPKCVCIYPKQAPCVAYCSGLKAPNTQKDSATDASLADVKPSKRKES